MLASVAKNFSYILTELKIMMHKSAITLSLFLMSTLIMLVPFTSINFQM
jgi:hypothetical protein